MGASNVVAAYALYAGRVPATSMQVLAYMAVVSKDGDPRPWFGQGHAALAEHALGRKRPITDSDERAVRRAITPLLQAGAITTDRPAARDRRDGPNTARYRLHLDVGRIPSCGSSPDLDGVDDPRRTDSGAHVGRNSDPRRTESVPTQDENRPTEEPRGTTRSEKTKEEEVDLRTAVTVARANGAANEPEISPDVNRPPARASPAHCERHPAMLAARCSVCRAQAQPAPSVLHLIVEGAA